MPIRATAVLALFAVATAGCSASLLHAPQLSAARERAARDFDCPISRVDAQLVGTREVWNVDLDAREQGPLVKVTGCDHERLYQCRTAPSRGRDRRFSTEDVPVCWAEGTLVDEHE